VSWLRRPVRLRHVLLVYGLTLLAWAGALAAGARYVLTHQTALLSLRDVTAVLSLPHDLHARAEALTPLQTRLDWEPTVAVPVHQTVRVQLPAALHAQARIESRVPIDTFIDFAGDIPVSLDLEVDVPVRRWLPTARVKLPVSLRVPVKLHVPLQTEVPLALDTRVTAALDAPLDVPVHTTLQARVPIHTDVQGWAVNQTDFALHTPIDSLALSVARADLRVPLRQLRVQDRSR